MKKLIYCLSLSFCALFAVNTLHAQDEEKKELPTTLERRENKQVYFEKVYTVDGVSKADLYQRMKDWATTNLSSDNNIQFDDQGKDYISTTTRMPLEGLSSISVSYKISMHFKDGKVKLECPSFTYIAIGEGRLIETELGSIKYGSANKRIYRSFDKTFTKFLESFDAGVHAAGKKGDNW